MLIAQEFELAHAARKVAGILQSPAEVAAQLRTQDVPEDVLAAAPEIPARADAALRDAGSATYLRPAQRGEVDAILHGAPRRTAHAP